MGEKYELNLSIFMLLIGAIIGGIVGNSIQGVCLGLLYALGTLFFSILTGFLPIIGQIALLLFIQPFLKSLHSLFTHQLFLVLDGIGLGVSLLMSLAICLIIFAVLSD